MTSTVRPFSLKVVSQTRWGSQPGLIAASGLREPIGVDGGPLARGQHPGELEQGGGRTRPGELELLDGLLAILQERQVLLHLLVLVHERADVLDLALQLAVLDQLLVEDLRLRLVIEEEADHLEEHDAEEDEQPLLSAGRLDRRPALRALLLR
jgi:hypothetical protein